MLKNKYQIYTMEVMKCLKHIRTEQFFILMRLRFGATRDQTQRCIRQLCYGQKLQYDIGNKEYLHLPYKPCDFEMIRAVDVMLHVCANASPELATGAKPCKLNFFIQDEQGYRDFKVVFVPKGEERLISTQLLTQTKDFICTCLFIIEDERQIPLLSTKGSAYFVLTQENGNLVFLKN